MLALPSTLFPTLSSRSAYSRARYHHACTCRLRHGIDSGRCRTSLCASLPTLQGSRSLHTSCVTMYAWQCYHPQAPSLQSVIKTLLFLFPYHPASAIAPFMVWLFHAYALLGLLPVPCSRVFKSDMLVVNSLYVKFYW